LESSWSFECNCLLYKEGPTGPTGALREKVISFAKMDDFEQTSSQDISSFIDKPLQEGVGFKYYIMPRLHQLFITSYVHDDEILEALELGLRLAFVIAPAQVPPMSGDRKVELLYLVAKLIRLVNDARGVDGLDCESGYWLLRNGYVSEIKKWLGKKSMVALHERNLLDGEREEYLRHREGEPLGDEWNNKDRENLKKKLLECASIEGDDGDLATCQVLEEIAGES